MYNVELIVNTPFRTSYDLYDDKEYSGKLNIYRFKTRYLKLEINTDLISLSFDLQKDKDDINISYYLNNERVDICISNNNYYYFMYRGEDNIHISIKDDILFITKHNIIYLSKEPIEEYIISNTKAIPLFNEINKTIDNIINKDNVLEELINKTELNNYMVKEKK